MKIMSTLAVKGVLDELTPLFEAKHGIKIDYSFDPTVMMLRRVAAGERADAGFLTSDGIEQLCKEGLLQPTTRVDFAKSEVGLAVRAGAPKPDISTVDAVRKTLIDCKSIVYSRTGASGVFFASLIKKLGVEDVVNAKATIVNAGFTAETVAEGKAELGVQQISELMIVPGIDIAGALPQEIQENLLFAGAVFKGSDHPAIGIAFLKFLALPEHAGLYRRKGLVPVAA